MTLRQGAAPSSAEEMVSIIEDVIAASMEAAPDDLVDSEVAAFVEEGGLTIHHVHGDDPDVVNVFAGPTWLFRCTRRQYQEVMRRCSA